MNKDITLRYTHPSKYDVAPYATICKVMEENGAHKLYVQCSEDTNSSDWRLLDELLSSTFDPFIGNDFVAHCLYLSSGKTEDRCKHYQDLARIILKQAGLLY